MKNTKELYRFSIKTDGNTSCIKECSQKEVLAVMAQGDAEQDKALCAQLLRDLAKWALEQAEIIEDMEGIEAMPHRRLDKTYRAEIVEEDPVMFDFAAESRGMLPEEILNYYRNLYHAESMTTERGVMANALNDFFVQLNNEKKEGKA